MSHREEPRSGRGCFGAVVIVPFLALGGMFALIALTGSPQDAPFGAPAPARPTKTSMWWTEPLETPTSSLETVVVQEKQGKDVRGALLATTSKVTTTTVPATSTPDTTSSRHRPAERNETPTGGPAASVPGEPTELEPTTPPVSSTSTSAPPPPASSAPAEPPVLSEPADPPSTEVPTTSTPCPRSETPSPSPSPEPPTERSEPAPEPTPEPIVEIIVAPAISASVAG